MRAGVPARPRKLLTQFVGRGAEMAFLNRCFETLAAGSGQGVVLSGPAGIGKTRLLDEFLQELDLDRYGLIKLQCLPGLSNSPLAVIRDMCQILFSQAPQGTVLTTVEAALRAELLGEAIGPSALLASLSEHLRKQQSYGLINTILATLCAVQPLVLAFEDVHWLDATSRDCLEAMMEKSDGMPLLVVMTTRPTEDPPLSEAIVQLPPLGHQDGLKLLHHNSSTTVFEDQAANDLVRRAAGNPFFIEELVLAALSGGGRCYVGNFDRIPKAEFSCVAENR